MRNVPIETNVGYEFVIRNRKYQMIVLEEEDVEGDPTMCVYDDQDDEPIVSIHLAEAEISVRQDTEVNR
ncbi:MAG: hypothetical protein ABIQ65_15730 [Thermoanaerobaculia bacterium]